MDQKRTAVERVKRTDLSGGFPAYVSLAIRSHFYSPYS